MLRVVARLIADTLVVATVLFVSAGTLAWHRAWVLLAVMLAVRSLSAIAIFRISPALLRERATTLVHRNQPLSDRLILFAFMTTAFIGVPAVAALDAFHWHALPSPPLALSFAGLIAFALGWTIIGVALRANPFAVAVVRLQREREHSVVDTGIYSVIRHPMYAGNPLVNVGLGLWLGSYAAVLFAAVPLVLLMLRIALEEHLLLRELPGYAEYSARVRYRLWPGVW